MPDAAPPPAPTLPKPLPAPEISAAAPVAKPRVPISRIEPLAWITFDPRECVAGAYRGLASEQLGLIVAGLDGDLCRFRLGRISVPGAPWKADVSECSISSATNEVKLRLVEENLVPPGADCKVRKAVKQDEALAIFMRDVKGAADLLRVWDEPDAPREGTLRSPRVTLDYRVWPPFDTRPDLPALDATKLTPTRVTLKVPRGSPFHQLFLGDRARHFRASMPWRADLPGVGDQVGRYVAYDVELIQVEPPEPKTGPIVLDVATCEPGSGGLRYFGLGSMSARITGADAGSCLYDAMDEIEGGYRQQSCSLARELGKVTISFDGGLLQSEFPGECQTIKSGSVFREMSMLMAKPAGPAHGRLAIGGTAFELSWLEVAAGKGAPVARGKALRVRLSVWPASSQPRTLPLDDAQALIKNVVRTITPSKATLGRALDTAVRDMRAGGTRQFEVATDLAGPLLALLPPQTELFNGDFLVVSVTVVGGK